MRWLLSIFLIAHVLQVHSQDQPQFDKKTVKDADGNVYWPLSLPVYVQLSAKPDASDAIMLTNVKEVQMKDFAHPMKWDGHGIHFIRHIDNENLRSNEISFPVYVDGIAPVTNLTLSGAPTFTASKIFFGKNLTGVLKATDEMSGVGTTMQSINGDTYKSISEIQFNDEKEYTLKYFSADRVGNVEVPKVKVFTVDLSAPLSIHQTVNDHIDGKILSPRTLLTINSTDDLSGVKKTEYFFNSNQPGLYSVKTNLANLQDGEHTLSYFATDNVSNIEEKKQYTFYLDTKAPEVSSSFDANFVNVNGRYYTAKATTIQLTATDNKAGVKEIFYSINGGAETQYSSPFLLPQKQGAYSVRFKSVDNVNNKGPLTSNDQLKNIFLDDTPPSLSHTISSPKVFTRDTLFITKDANISLLSTDLESGSARIDYTVDGGASTTYSQSFQVAPEGKHTIGYTGVDKVNNSASKQFLFIVDNTAPEIFWHMSLEKIGTQKLEGKTNELPIYASGTSLYLAATDKLVGTKAIYYSLNNLPDVLYTQPVKVSSKGVHTLKMKAIDYLGNQNTTDVVEFVIQ